MSNFEESLQAYESKAAGQNIFAETDPFQLRSLQMALPTQEEEDECPSPDFFIRNVNRPSVETQPILVSIFLFDTCKIQSPCMVHEDDLQSKNEKRSEQSTDKQESTPDVVMDCVVESLSVQADKQMANEHLQNLVGGMLINLGDGSKLDCNPDNDDLTQAESKIMEYFTTNKDKFDSNTELQVYQLIFLKNAF